PDAYHFAFVLRDGGQNVDGQTGRVRHIHRDEVGGRLHQARDEMYVSGETVQFGNNERGSGSLALRDRGGQLRAVAVALARFDLGELGLDGCRLSLEVPGDGCTLGVQTEPAFSLAGSRYPVVGDVG